MCACNCVYELRGRMVHEVIMPLRRSDKQCNAATCCTLSITIPLNINNQTLQHLAVNVRPGGGMCLGIYVVCACVFARTCVCVVPLPPAGLSGEPQQDVRDIKGRTPNMVCTILCLHSLFLSLGVR